MLGLPANTEIGRQLPKRTVYAKFDMKHSVQECFDADVSKIVISNEISIRTIPTLSAGNTVQAFFVLAVSLKREDYKPENVAMLSRLIPQRMVFALLYEDKVQLAVFFTKLFVSEWQQAEECKISLQGLTVEDVWENIVRQIGGIKQENDNTLDEQITENERKVKLQKQIEALEKKARQEVQPRRKFELVQQINELKKQI